MELLADLARLRTRRVLAVAGVFFAVALVLGAPITSKLKAQPSDFQDPASQNQTAAALIASATGHDPEFGLAALVQTPGDVRTSAPEQRKAARVAALLQRQPGFQRLIDYPATHNPTLVSRDGQQTLVLAAFAKQSQAYDAAQRLRAQLRGHRVLFGGRDVTFEHISHRTSSDLATAELLAFPLLLLLSIWVFRGLVAAALPPLIGALAIVASFLGLRLVNQFDGLSIFAVNLVTGMGLGLSIDYSLFIVARYREEVARVTTIRVALRRTLLTAGRTVLFSCLTVAAAMASLTVFPLRFLYSMGIGGMLTALSTGAVSLVVLPAVLVLLGPRINSLAPAWLQRSRQRAAQPAETGLWFRLAQAVMRRPATIGLAAAALLVATGLPFLRIAFTPASARVLPANAEERVVAEAVAANFAVDGSQRIAVVLRTGATGAAAVKAFAARAAALPGGAQAIPPQYLGRSTWELDLLPRGSAYSAANKALVRRLRTLPAAFPVYVGGATAAFLDQQSSIGSHIPLAVLILGLTTIAALFAMTGSIVLPIKALAMNMLTVTVAAGGLVLVFQDGHLSGLLNFRSDGGLEASNLVLLFTLAFALSTDYGVFLFARIKEARESGLSNRDAIALGLERTGRLVTAAALLFCVAIGAFVTSHVLFIKQLGFGTALAVALDASVVRALLVPSLMALMGDWTWWAPAPLRRLHARLRLGERELPPHAPPGRPTPDPEGARA
jgi:RND superfamily putative drug exporter